jgi:hypothetical protein
MAKDPLAKELAVELVATHQAAKDLMRENKELRRLLGEAVALLKRVDAFAIASVEPTKGPKAKRPRKKKVSKTQQRPQRSKVSAEI